MIPSTDEFIFPFQGSCQIPPFPPPPLPDELFQNNSQLRVSNSHLFSFI